MLLLIEGDFTIEFGRAGFLAVFGARASAIHFADYFVRSYSIEDVGYYFFLGGAALLAGDQG